MEEVSMKPCSNCKRDIPIGNYITHSIHCSRNIKICTVCKEPVLLTDLQEHHDKLHVLLPCQKCKEMVRGTDMEDHIRDSCDFTMQTCRFCALDLMRREMPAHERYCGTRTEKCKDCGEYVMIRYRQLHLDSNHAFVCLEEDTPTVNWRRSNHESAPRARRGEQPPPPMFRHNRDEEGRRLPMAEDEIRRRVMDNFPLFYPQVIGVTKPEDIRRLRETLNAESGPRPLRPPYTGLLMPVPEPLPPDYDMQSLRAIRFVPPSPLFRSDVMPPVDLAPPGEMQLGQDAASFRESIRLARSAARKRQAPAPPGTRMQSGQHASAAEDQSRHEEPSRDQPDTSALPQDTGREQQQASSVQQEARLDEQQAAAGQPPAPESASEAERQRMIETLRRKEEEAKRKKLLLERLTVAAREAAEGFGSGRSTFSVGNVGNGSHTGGVSHVSTAPVLISTAPRAWATAIFNANNANVQVPNGESQPNRFNRGIWLENATHEDGAYIIDETNRAIMEAQVLGEPHEINAMSEVNNCVNAVDTWARIVQATSGCDLGAQGMEPGYGANPTPQVGPTNGPTQWSLAMGATNGPNAGQPVAPSMVPIAIIHRAPTHVTYARAQTKSAINEANARAQANGAANGANVNSQANGTANRANVGVPTSTNGSITQELGTVNNATATITNGVGARPGPANGANAGAQAVGAINGANAGTQGMGAIDGANAGTQGVGAINGANAGTQAVGAINGANARAQAVGAINGANAGTQAVGAINGANARAQAVGAVNGANAGNQAVGAINGANAGARTVAPANGANVRAQAVAPASGSNNARPQGAANEENTGARTFVFINGGVNIPQAPGNANEAATPAMAPANEAPTTQAVGPANGAHDVNNATVGNNSPNAGSAPAAPQPSEERQRSSLRNLEPMTPEEFTIRFRQLQVRRDPRDPSGDRFGVIRASLRDLRRGLNEVLAPFNNNNGAPNNNARGAAHPHRNPAVGGLLEEARAPTPASVERVEELLLPCEICSHPVAAPHLEEHETECRNYFVETQAAEMAAIRDIEYVPMIPCEFCTETLPYYRITEHQEMCRRDSYLLDLD